MNVIDHLSLGVPDIAEARQFYDATLAALGLPCLAATDGFAAYGKDAVQFLVMKPENGDVFSSGNGTHICFVAESRDAVDAFHSIALHHGGHDAGSPGLRPSYPKADVYAAFIRDPYGHKLEAIFNGFAA